MNLSEEDLKKIDTLYRDILNLLKQDLIVNNITNLKDILFFFVYF